MPYSFSKNLELLGIKIGLLIAIVIICSPGCLYAQQGSSFLKTKVETIGSSKLQKTAKVKQVLRNLEIPVPKKPTGKMIINIQDLLIKSFGT